MCAMRRLVASGWWWPAALGGLAICLASACSAPAAPSASGQGAAPAGVAASPAANGGALRQEAPAPPQPPTRVSIAYSIRGTGQVFYHIAMEEGYAREEGLDSEMLQLAGTPAAQAVLARQID